MRIVLIRHGQPQIRAQTAHQAMPALSDYIDAL